MRFFTEITRLASLGLLLSFGLLAQQAPIEPRDRIRGRLDRSHFASVKGNIHPKARPENDRGRVSPNLLLDYVTLHLKPTPAQQADLDQFLVDVQDRNSPNHYRWLTPEQYADRFGASQSDIAQIVEWLEGEGLTVLYPARGRNFVSFKGTASQVEAALHTEIHDFLVDSETHYANVTEPSVPMAILPFTIGFSGLDDFRLKPSPQVVRPVANFNSGNQHSLAPGDLWVIYNTLPLLNAGINGTGMKMVVAGQSDVNVSDMETFRNAFGLVANDPVKLLAPGATNPGVVAGDTGESDLDLEWAAAMAPLAQVTFVYAKSVAVAAAYAIDSAIAPVVSYSYAGCEVSQSASAASTYQQLAQQANAQGITWLASSGDQGAAACDGGNTVAAKGISVNLPASVPEVTGVGGTTFSEAATASYWGANGLFGDSAQSYIPEVGWNDTSIQGQLSSSGGGMSIFFPRPAWQSAPGVQRINVRFVPDVAAAASPDHDGYNVVEGGAAKIVGGTSASTPVFAGMLVLLNQFLNTNGLGNINPGLYELASGNTGNIFHDVQAGNNFVPCVAGTTGCLNGSLGYSAGPGYDMVTGLGTVNANNLALAWKAANQPSLTQIINGASYSDSGLAPGLIFAVKGSGLGPSTGETLQLNAAGNIANNLSGVQVLVNGTAAPITYISATQINAVAPYEIANMVGQRVNVQVINNGIISASLSDMVVSSVPAIFNLGNNQAAAVNSDGTVNGASNPAARGSYVSIYATGEGQTNPPGIDGFVPTSAANLSTPIGKVAVFMNQFSAQVLYAGTASFDGFFQVNAVIPQGLAPGATPLTLTVGGVASPTLNIYVK